MSTGIATPPVPNTETALLMIDMQNYFLHEKGSCARRYGQILSCMAAAVGPARRVITAARAGGIPVIHTQNAHEPGFPVGGFLPDEIGPKVIAQLPYLQQGGDHLVIGSWEAEFLESVAPVSGEYVVQKCRPDAFIGTALERLLMRLKVRTLVVGGVATTVCVESTVRDAAMRDYRVFVVGDATGDLDQAVHDDGLNRLARWWSHLVTADDVCDAFAPGFVS